MTRSKIEAPRSSPSEPAELRRAETLLMLRPVEDNAAATRIGWAVVRGIGAAAALIVLCLVFVAVGAARAGGF